MSTSADSPRYRKPCSLQEGDPSGIVLPGTGHQRPAPPCRVITAQVGSKGFRPGQGLLLDPRPLVLRQHLPVELLVAQHGVAHQTAALAVPQADVLRGFR